MNEKASELLGELGGRLLKAISEKDEKWVDCMVRVERDEKGALHYSFGYHNEKDPDKKLPFIITEDSMAFFMCMSQFCENTKSKKDEYWKVCRVGIKKESMKVKIDYEWEDEKRWKKDIYE